MQQELRFITPVVYFTGPVGSSARKLGSVKWHGLLIQHQPQHKLQPEWLWGLGVSCLDMWLVDQLLCSEHHAAVELAGSFALDAV